MSMFELMTWIFTGIGYAVATFGLVFGLACLAAKISSANKERKERHARILTAIERIEQNTHRTS